jgi:hypothetical protein
MNQRTALRAGVCVVRASVILYQPPTWLKLSLSRCYGANGLVSSVLPEGNDA